MTDLPKNLIVSFSDSRASQSLLNESFTDTYSIGVSNDNMLTAALGERANIGKITLKWTASYAKEYNIEVSDDGNSWRTVKTVENALGGIEGTALEGAVGKYLRISGVKAQDGSIDEPALYGVSAYAAPYGISDIDRSDDSYSYDEIKKDEDIDDEYEETVVVRRRRKKKPTADNTIFGMPVWLFVLICSAAGAAVVGGITVIIIVRRKKRNAEQIKSRG